MILFLEGDLQGKVILPKSKTRSLKVSEFKGLKVRCNRINLKLLNP